MNTVRVASFVQALRTVGVPVSTAETLDGIAAVCVIGLESREQLRHALATTMVKRAEHIQRFYDVFDAHFPLRVALHPDLFVDEDLREALRQALAAHDEERISAVLAAAVMQLSGLESGRYLGVDYHLRRVSRMLGLPGAVAVGEGTTLEQRLEALDESQRAADLRDRLSGEIRTVASTYQGQDWAISETGRHLAEKYEFLRASPHELEEMDLALRAMSRRLAARLRNSGLNRKGKLQFAATVRRSLSSGGIPFDPKFSRRIARRSDLVVLADVSGSVSTFARFTLQLLHGVARQFRHLRIFAFVDEVDEVTGSFGPGRDLPDAIAAVNSSTRTLGPAGHSDYGNVFESFAARWSTSLRPTTTLLILGDARNNYHEVRAERLEELTRRARHTYWLNPEPRQYWDTADSVMARYAPYCDEVLECRDLAQLASAVDHLS